MNPLSDSEFEALAARVAAGEASSTEQETLRTLCVESTARAQEWREIELAFQSVRLASALNPAPETDVVLPEYRKAGLRTVVAKTFSIKTESSTPKPESMAWMSWFWRGSAGLALALVFAMVAIPSRHVVQVGLYRPEVVRGGNALAMSSTDRVQVNQFDSDGAFEKWLARPFEANEKARLWLDDTAGVIRVKVAPQWWSDGKEWTRPLSAQEDERKHQIQEVLAEINSD